MNGDSRKRAVKNCRGHLTERGMARFEVLGRKSDRELVRAFARRLAEDGPDAVRLRAAINGKIVEEPPERGGILAALRHSPLVDEDIDIDRFPEPGRDVDL